LFFGLTLKVNYADAFERIWSLQGHWIFKGSDSIFVA